MKDTITDSDILTITDILKMQAPDIALSPEADAALRVLDRSDPDTLRARIRVWAKDHCNLVLIPPVVYRISCVMLGDPLPG